LAEVWPVGGKPAPQRRQSLDESVREKELQKIVSFSSGPKSIPTHWKQTLFLLREPITVSEGTSVRIQLEEWVNIDLGNGVIYRSHRLGDILLSEVRREFPGA
jgi:hypothetical protein